MTIRVLLADDHAILRDGLRALLHSTEDIRVVAEAADGREALRLALDFDPHVAIMDIAMPELNGIEAVRLLREKRPATRVVMLSMHSSAEHVHRALAAGAAGFLLKEAAGGELVTAVRAVHAGNRYLSRAIAEFAQGRLAPGDSLTPLESLSGRERQVLQLVVEGKSSAEIARIVHLSPKSVETYRSRLMKKLGVTDVPALVKFAIQHGLTPPG
jgi:DNA-binding NarL/FixJ family response regulator